MGHQIDYTRFDINCDRKKVQAQMDDYASHVDWQEGCSGLPNNIRWLDVVLPNYDAAIKYIEAHDSGWYDQIAVKYREYSDLVPSVKYNKLRYRLQDAQKAYRELADKVHYSDVKSEFIGCKECGSRISRKHLRSNYCPVCGEDLRPASTLDRIAKAKERIDKLMAEINEEHTAMELKQLNCSKLMWLVKTEFHV